MIRIRLRAADLQSFAGQVHFDQSGVPVVDEYGQATGKTTTVRVKKTFASEDGTTEDGTVTTEYFHVASINDEDGSYVHPFKQAGGNIYQCTAGGVRVDLTNFNDSPDFTTVTMIASVEGSTVKLDEYAPIQQRAFGVSFRATFVQSSEVPNS